jgi:hypothetical protein
LKSCDLYQSFNFNEKGGLGSNKGYKEIIFSREMKHLIQENHAEIKEDSVEFFFQLENFLYCSFLIFTIIKKTLLQRTHMKRSSGFVISDQYSEEDRSLGFSHGL